MIEVIKTADEIPSVSGGQNGSKRLTNVGTDFRNEIAKNLDMTDIDEVKVFVRKTKKAKRIIKKIGTFDSLETAHNLVYGYKSPSSHYYDKKLSNMYFVFQKVERNVLPEIEASVYPDQTTKDTFTTVDAGDFVNYKFNEDAYVKEIKEYIDSTYTGHYSKDKFQASEFIQDAGHGTGFNMGNVMKYAQRYGNKGTKDDARKDLMKVLHYAILQLYVHDTNPNE